MAATEPADGWTPRAADGRWGVVVGSALVSLAALAFWGYCVYDFARTDERDMRTFTQPVWLVLLVFANVLGALLWYAAGRPQGPTRR